MFKARLERLKHFFEKHERALGFTFLIGGFIFDNLTLQRVDVFLDNLVLLSYLAIIAVGIIVINLGIQKIYYLVPYIMQFAFGGLFSGYIVFYFRSAALSISWPFLLMLALFFIGNELLRKRYELLTFHLAIFFIAVFSYSIFSLPVVFNKIGVGIFILSGLVSLAVVAGLVYLIKKTAPQRVAGHRGLIILTIGAIYLVFNIFYFTNIIPPIPLALKDGGIYHHVQKLVSGDYLVLDEKRAWYQFFSKDKVHILPGQPVYAYSAVFAPTRLETKIFHRWSYYDDARKEWAVSSRVGFLILGGRDQGYRSYSVKEITKAGAWRVDVITERDQVIGRMQFRAVITETAPELESVVR